MAALQKQQIITEIPDDDEPIVEKVKININNMVSTFNVHCQLNLREIACRGYNVEHRRESNMLTMRLRRPYTTAAIRSSGHITCTGAATQKQSKVAARRYARCLQMMGFRVAFQDFRVVNVFASCYMPWAINIKNFAMKYYEDTTYDPQLHPAAVYRVYDPKATLKIYSTGSIIFAAPSVANIKAAAKRVFPMMREFKKDRSLEELKKMYKKEKRNANHDGTVIVPIITNHSNLDDSSAHSNLLAANDRKARKRSRHSNKNSEEKKRKREIATDEVVEEHNDDMASDLQNIDEDDIIVYSPCYDSDNIDEESEDEEDIFTNII